MNASTDVYLITGFLGSGKTTFLNRIIDRFPKDRKMVILVNEFGDIGVDGATVAGEEIDTIEISKGSIFCACVKADFIKALCELQQKVKPDVLIIESTGVANPVDLKKDLKLSIFNNRFRFAEQFCVLDAAHFLDAYGAFVSLEKQIASSTVFIINKIDLVTDAAVTEIKQVVEQFHTSPLFLETCYADVDPGPFIDLPPMTNALPPADAENACLSEAELEIYINHVLNQPALEITPPDQLVSAVYQYKGDDIAQVETMAALLPRAVLRAKGILKTGDRFYLFSYVMGDWTIEPIDIAKSGLVHPNTVVFIGPPTAFGDIQSACPSDDWLAMGAGQPGESGA